MDAANNTERLKYHLIVDGESKSFANSLEEAEALAVEHADGHSSMRIETLSGVAPSVVWHFDYPADKWVHIQNEALCDAQPR